MMSIILFIIILFLELVIETSFAEKNEEGKKFPTPVGIVSSIIVAAVVAAINWAAKPLAMAGGGAWAVVAGVLTVIMLGVLIYQASRWFIGGGALAYELAAFGGVGILLLLVAMATTSAATVAAPEVIRIIVTTFGPVFAFVGYTTSIVADFFFFRASDAKEDGRDAAKWWSAAGWTTIVVAIIATIIILIVAGIKCFRQIPAADAAPEEEPPVVVLDIPAVEEPEEEVEETVPYRWDNLQCLLNDDTEDDYNFGLDPTQDDWGPEEYFEDMMSKSYLDINKGISLMWGCDRKFHSRYLQTFYQAYPDDEYAQFEAAKYYFMNNFVEYYALVEQLEARLERCDLEVVKAKARNQLFQDPFVNIDGTPALVAYEVEPQEYLVLRIKDKIKGEETIIDLSVHCDYQICDVDKVSATIKVTPKPTPQPGGSGGGTPEPGPGGDVYKKDINARPKTEYNQPNEDKNSKGKDTNNGAGSVVSKDEPKNGSADYKNPKDYIKDNQQEQQSQQDQQNKNAETGGSNTPAQPSNPATTNGGQVNGGKDVSQSLPTDPT